VEYLILHRQQSVYVKHANLFGPKHRHHIKKYTLQWHIPPALVAWLDLLVAAKNHSEKQVLGRGTKKQAG
jgi:hypothetical protein